MKPPVWEDFPVPASTHVPQPELRYRQIAHGETMEYLPAILDIEYQVYEPARRTPPAEIRAAIEDRDGSLIVCEAPGGIGAWTLVGFAIGGPLEQSKDVEGCDDDPMLGKHNSMYSVSITVAPTYQSAGIGRKLKALQLQDAAARKKPDGAPRYRYVTGRNRVGRTAEMTHLNRVYGAHVVQVMTGQYEDPEGQAIYYRIPLGAFEPDPVAQEEAIARRAAQQVARESTGRRSGARSRVGHDQAVRERSGVARRGGAPRPAVRPGGQQAHADELRHARCGARARVARLARAGAAASVPDVVARRSVRQGAAADPLHAQASGDRDRARGRLLRSHRRVGAVALGSGGPSRWARLTSRGRAFHIRRARAPRRRSARCAAAVEAAGKDKVLGFFYEPVQERTGWVLPPDFVDALGKLRSELDLPLIALENTTHTYRSGKGAFVSPALGLVPGRARVVGRRPDRLSPHRPRAGSSARRSRWSRPGTVTSSRSSASTTNCAQRATSTSPAASAALDSALAKVGVVRPRRVPRDRRG